MTAKKTDAQMFLEEQLQDPEVAESFYEGLDELRIAVQIVVARLSRFIGDPSGVGNGV